MDINWERIFRDDEEKWYETLAWNIVFRRWFFRLLFVIFGKDVYSPRDFPQDCRH